MKGSSRNASAPRRQAPNNIGDDREHRIYVSYTNGRRTRYHHATEEIDTIHMPPLQEFSTEQDVNYRCDCIDYSVPVGRCIRSLNNKDEYLGFSYNDELQKALNNANNGERVANNKMRFKLYRKSWLAVISVCPEIYSVTNDNGRYSRKRLPQCVEYTVRSIWPEQDGFYTGFKPNN